jgi:methionyl-tRNA formyltransferase
MRLVFAGTPMAAVPALDALLKSRHQVAAVITRPDARAGRGLKLGRSPVAQRAAEAGIEVLTPARPSEPEFLATLREIGPDCCPVTAYGALLPQAALDIPPHGWVNLHFSVLPAWRGAAPVQHAILHGDDVTGATTFDIVRELDAGPVYGVVTEAIRPDDTAGGLLERLSTAGADLLVATLDGIESGALEAREQPADGISLAPKITPADAEVDWRKPAIAIGRQIRACTPEPGAWTQLDGVRIKLWPVTLAPGSPAAGPAVAGSPGPVSTGTASTGTASTGTASTGTGPLAPGELRMTGHDVLAGTGSTPVMLGDVQANGKRRMPASDWARGLRLDRRSAVLG